MHQHSDQLNELAAALAKAQATMRPAVKEKKNPFLGSRYADLESVIDACKDALSENGLAISALPGLDENGGRVLYTYLLHASGQWMCSAYPIVPGFIERKGQGVVMDANGEPMRNDTPQGIGSAITYARRYAILSLCNIATSDDDGEAAMGRNDDHHVPQSRRTPQHDPAQVPATFRQHSAQRGRGRPPKAQAPVETSELFQEVMETIREASSQEDLSTASELAMGLDGEEQAQARAAWRQRREALTGAANRSESARDSIKASLTLPKPA